MHLVTYTDATFVKYAAMSLFTMLRTQSPSKITVLHPALAEADRTYDGQTLVQFLEYARSLDPRICTLCVDDISSDIEGLQSRSSHPELFTDIIRSHLVAFFGEPIVWVDSDMLFLDDLRPSIDKLTAVFGAVDDVASNFGDLRGLRAFRSFQVFASEHQGIEWVSGLPINCGFLVLAQDTVDHYAVGLALAEEFVATFTGPPETTEIVQHARGQMAWNYVFHVTNGERLHRRLNRIPRNEPILTPDGALAEPDTAIIHYIGGGKANRMTLDFVTLVHAGRL